MGINYSTSNGNIVNSLFNQETVMDFDCFNGYMITQDQILGDQIYLILNPGCDGRIEASENFEDRNGVVVLISIQRDNNPNPRYLRLTHDGQSLAGFPADRIYIPTIVNGRPRIPSLARLNAVRAQLTGSNTNVGPIDLNARNGLNALNNNGNNSTVNSVINALNNNGRNAIVVNAVNAPLNSRAPVVVNAVTTSNGLNANVNVGRRRIGGGPGCACNKKK